MKYICKMRQNETTMIYVKPKTEDSYHILKMVSAEIDFQQQHPHSLMAILFGTLTAHQMRLWTLGYLVHSENSPVYCFSATRQQEFLVKQGFSVESLYQNSPKFHQARSQGGHGENRRVSSFGNLPQSIINFITWG